MTLTNPLLDFSGFPSFDLFQPEQVTPAITALLSEAREMLAKVEASPVPATWENTVDPIDDATERLARAWGIVEHLNAVMDSPEQRAVYRDNLPNVTAFWTDLAQSTRLFARYRALESAQLSNTQREILRKTLQDAILGGVELPPPAREAFSDTQKELAQLSQRFSENTLDATNAYVFWVTDQALLEGIPPDVQASAQQNAPAAAGGGPAWRFTLQFPSYFPILQYAASRPLREQVYHAYATRAAEPHAIPEQPAVLQANPEASASSNALPDRGSSCDNSPVIQSLLQLRKKQAALLGYDNYAQMSLVPKMADSPATVMHFLRDLAERARPFAQKDWEALQTFARQSLNLPRVEAWDFAFSSEKLKQAQHGVSEQVVKQYFQLPNVLAGLFSLSQALFSLTIHPDSAPTWHPDVLFFRVERLGKTLGHFYLDPYARPSKRSGAWMDGARSRRRLRKPPAVSANVSAGTQTPLAYLVCNFQPPPPHCPALLTHDDVLTLFHEFGHGLHHLLTAVDELRVSGISGVEWDAVELPSQFMENFCWEFHWLEKMSAHAVTGAPLPRHLFEAMLAAKNFQSGLQTLRQVEFSLFDLRLHTEPAPTQSQQVQDLLNEVRKEIAIVHPPEWNRFQNTFSHIFAGGYSAGYYSYKWAEVLSADAYAAFEAIPPTDTTAFSEVGDRFLKEILSVGGSRPAAQSFRAFRGRGPEIDALLRHNGMVAATPTVTQSVGE